MAGNGEFLKFRREGYRQCQRLDAPKDRSPLRGNNGKWRKPRGYASLSQLSHSTKSSKCGRHHSERLYLNGVASREAVTRRQASQEILFVSRHTDGSSVRHRVGFRQREDTDTRPGRHPFL